MSWATNASNNNVGNACLGSHNCQTGVGKGIVQSLGRRNWNQRCKAWSVGLGHVGQALIIGWWGRGSVGCKSCSPGNTSQGKCWVRAQWHTCWLTTIHTIRYKNNEPKGEGKGHAANSAARSCRTGNNNVKGTHNQGNGWGLLGWVRGQCGGQKQQIQNPGPTK